MSAAAVAEAGQAALAHAILLHRPGVVGGLVVRSLRGEGKAWYVEHAVSGVPVFGGGYLRQKRFALECRADLLATGVNFELPLDGLRGGALRPAWRVMQLWKQRAQQDSTDPVTGEHYSWSTHYGQDIPSAAQAAAYRARLAAEAEAEYAAQLAAWETDGGA